MTVRATAPFDHGALAAEIASALARLGLSDADVIVSPVDRLERGPSGKLKRFVPLGR